MSKKVKPAISYDAVTPAMVSLVRDVIGEADKHKYSVSRVYAAYNAAYNKRDQPQTCSSCLRNRVRELKAWYNGLPRGNDPASTPPTVHGVLTRLGMEADDEESEQIAIDAALHSGVDITEDERAVLQSRMGGSIYDKLVKRLGMSIGDTPAEELATLGTVLETDGYPFELTPDEREAIIHRITNLGGFTEPQYDDPTLPNHVPPAPGVIRYLMGEGVVPMDFTPGTEDANKGTVLNADGSKVKAGTYTTAIGHEIAVQPGGKATIKTEDLT